MKFFQIKIKYHFWKNYFTLLNYLKVPLRNPKIKTLVLVYHGIVEKNSTKYNSRFTTIDEFKKHLHFFEKHCSVIPLNHFFYSSKEEKKLNIIITFDDGYKNNLKYVVPLLQEKKIPATFCIPTQDEFSVLWPDLLDILKIEFPNEIISFKKKAYEPNKDYKKLKHLLIASSKIDIIAFLKENNHLINLLKTNPKTNDYWQLLSREEIKMIQNNSLFEIVPHGHYHLSQQHITKTDAKNEIRKSIQIAKDLTNQDVHTWAIPFGFYTNKTIQFLRNEGITKILAVDKLKDDFYESSIPRFVINPHININLLKRFIFKGKYY